MIATVEVDTLMSGTACALHPVATRMSGATALVVVATLAFALAFALAATLSHGATLA